MGTPRRFVVDAMLGDLARDLRLLGHDVAYDARVPDDALLAQAHQGQRHLLTRDRELARRAGAHGLLVRGVRPGEALREVHDALALEPAGDAFLSRCTACGGELDAVPSVEVTERLPPSVAKLHAIVRRCRGCQHIYWEGSHVRAIRERLREFIERE